MFYLLQKTDEIMLVENTDKNMGSYQFDALSLSEETYCIFSACTYLKYGGCYLKRNYTCSTGNGEGCGQTQSVLHLQLVTLSMHMTKALQANWLWKIKAAEQS